MIHSHDSSPQTTYINDGTFQSLYPEINSAAVAVLTK